MWLKPTHLVSGSLPEVDVTGLIAAKLITILDRRMMKKRHAGVVYVLVQWSNASREDATWEPYDDIVRRFPEFNLEA